MEPDDDYEAALPKGAIITSVLTIVEYLHPDDGELWKADFSYDSAGNELPWGKVSELCDYARMNSQAPILAQMIRQINENQEEQ